MEDNPRPFVRRVVGAPAGQGGFLLLETLLAIVFLTVGLTTVLRSYGSSLEALGISADYTKALVLLERSLWPYEAAGSIAPGTFSGEFSEEDGNFQWEIEASEIMDLGICEIRATVSWEKRGKVRHVSVVTYLKRE
jgi:hypothetical protein